MRSIAFVLIRAVSVAWGLLELSGFLWFHTKERDALIGLYWVAPALALLALGLAPAKLWSNLFGRKVLLAFATIGVLRSIHVAVADMSASGGPDLSSAVLRVITVALLVLLVWAKGGASSNHGVTVPQQPNVSR